MKIILEMLLEEQDMPHIKKIIQASVLLTKNAEL